jgi:hypothetical protein
MHPSAWEAVFFLVALKIPVAFVGYVVWRAIKAVPEPEEPTTLVPVADTPPAGDPWTPRRDPTRPDKAHAQRRPASARHPRQRTYETK